MVELVLELVVVVVLLSLSLYDVLIGIIVDDIPVIGFPDGTIVGNTLGGMVGIRSVLGFALVVKLNCQLIVQLP